MKKIAGFFIYSLLLTAAISYGQTNPIATQLANHIAQKMKDSLGLTEQQRNQVYDINMQLHNQKMSLRQQYGNSDSTRFYTQRIEGTRDSLYHTIITGNTYTLYLQKKRNLVTAN